MASALEAPMNCPSAGPGHQIGKLGDLTHSGFGELKSSKFKTSARP
jgi:hypothetical protein